MDRAPVTKVTLVRSWELVLQEDVTDKQQDTEQVQLRIAWQYRRYIKSKQKAAATAASSRCADHGS